MSKIYDVIVPGAGPAGLASRFSMQAEAACLF